MSKNGLCVSSSSVVTAYDGVTGISSNLVVMVFLKEFAIGIGHNLESFHPAIKFFEVKLACLAL